MENKKIEQIYQMIIREVTLNNNNLNNSFSNEEINELLKDNIIYLQGDEYKLTSTKGLYKYGTKLVLTRNTKDAYICFQRCVELDNQNREAYLELIYFAIKKRDYQKALELFNICNNINYEENKHNNDLYLYLLNMLITNPNNNITIIQNPKITTKENSIRYAIQNYKYSYAIKQLNEILIENNYAYNVELSLLKELLSQLAGQERNFKFTILNHARRKEYEEIIHLLEEKSTNRYLTNRETYTYLITKAIINIKTTKVIPTVYQYKTTQIYEAIKGNNFKLALELDTKFNNKLNSNNENSIVNILLIEINKLIAYLEEEEKIKELSNNYETETKTKPKTLTRSKTRTEK